MNHQKASLQMQEITVDAAGKCGLDLSIDVGCIDLRLNLLAFSGNTTNRYPLLERHN